MDKKISQLTAASTPLVGTETLPIVQAGQTVKATVQDVLGYVVNDSTNSVLKTVYSASDIGLKLDFANNSYVLGGINDGYNVRVTGFDPNGGVDIGDYNLYASGTQINLRQDFIKTQFNGNDIGLKLDFANDVYVLGDYNGVSNHTYITVDNASAFISLLCSGYGVYQQFDGINGNIEISSQNIIKTTNNGNDVGLLLDFGNNLYEFGGKNVNGNYIQVDDAASEVQIVTQGSRVMFEATQTYTTIGDVTGVSNTTTFGVDDAGQTLTASPNLLSGSASGSSGLHLKVNIGGSDYKIALLNA